MSQALQRLQDRTGVERRRAASRPMLARVTAALVAALLLAVVAFQSPSSARESATPASFPAAALYSELSQAVVGITCQDGRLGYFGTGAVIDPTGLVLTSVTVVPESASRILVYLRGGRVVSGRLLAWEVESEFALIKIDPSRAAGPDSGDSDGAASIPYVSMGRSARARLGDPVYVLGNAFQCIVTDDRVSMSAGIVSGLYSLDSTQAESRYLGPVIETNAPVNNGMDGGPIVDAAGRLLGVISLNYSRNRWLGTAVPIDRLKPLVSKYRGWFSDRAGGYAAYAGLELEEVGGTEIRVLDAIEGGPAAAAGLRPGSRIVKVNGEEPGTLSAFARLFSKRRPGGQLVLETVGDDGRTSTVEFTLWARF